MDKPKIKKLSNGLTLITVDVPHLESVTSMVAVGAGTRYENSKNNGISHFLEHMFFKGSKKYPSAEVISTVVDGMGAINNAWTSHEVTVYWIKSSTKNLVKSADILSSMMKESLLESDEIEREKGVIVEEMKRSKDNPASYVWRLYHKLHFGSHPLAQDVLGEEEGLLKFNRKVFTDYMHSLYGPSNMVLAFAGGLPKDIEKLAQDYFGDFKNSTKDLSKTSKLAKQDSSKVDLFYKDTDQANIVMGVRGFARGDNKKYAARLIAAILGEGMSSRLFLQIRERRGLAYSVGVEHESYNDTGILVAYAGLKKDKLEEAIKVIKDEMQKIIYDVTEEELKKVKEMIRGKLYIRSESTNALAEMFGLEYLLEGKVMTNEEYLAILDKISLEDIKQVAKELFSAGKFNLQIIGPYKHKEKFKMILDSR